MNGLFYKENFNLSGLLNIIIIIILTCFVSFLRAVAYLLPHCAYNKIMKHFPDENGEFYGFEDDED